MQSVLNLKVKYRESFRPFAPSVLREDVADWFELDADSPYMLLVADVAKRHRKTTTEAADALFGIDKLKAVRSTIPAVTHVDYSARLQTVHRETNPRYYALIDAFRQRTGCPVLVNTSFNVRGEPIVCSAEDAFRCFMGTEIEALAVGNCYLRKDEQNPARRSIIPHHLIRIEVGASNGSITRGVGRRRRPSTATSSRCRSGARLCVARTWTAVSLRNSVERAPTAIGGCSMDLGVTRRCQKLGNESGLRDCILFRHPSHSALPNHMHGFDSLQGPPSG